MRTVIIVIIMLISSVVQAESLSGHWQNNNNRFFLYQKANNINIWTTIEGEQIGFEVGEIILLSPKNDINSALYEINAKSNEKIILYHNNKACEIKGLSFSLFGLLSQSGYRGRNMEFHGGLNITGIIVCGKKQNQWSNSYLGSWKRL